MKIIAADDEPYALKNLTRAIREAKPDAKIEEFLEPEELLAYAKEHPVDVAFLDIELGSMSGIEVAKQLKIWYPRINLIFVTAYDKYMAQAIQLRMSGYVCKPVTGEKIAIELEDLRKPVLSAETKKPRIRCFGNFDVFVDGRLLEFEKIKTKEMLAYLVDRRGSSVTTGELRSVLWESALSDENTRSYLSKVKKDLVNTLKRAGIREIFVQARGKYAIDPDRVSCDYYDYLDNKPEGVRAYNGEYMAQYSWGEINHVVLQDRTQKR